MTNLTLCPQLWFTGLDAAGVTLPGAQVFFYASGTTNKLDTYSTADGSATNTNPLILDSAGRGVAYLKPAAYKVVFAPAGDSDPPSSPIKTVDPVGAVPPTSVDVDVQAVAGEAIAAGDAVYLDDGSGSRTAGRWYKADITVTSLRSQAAPVLGMAPAAIASSATGSVRLYGRITGLAGLTIGASYRLASTAGAITTVALNSNARLIGVADSATSLVLAEKRDTNVRVVWVVTTASGNVGAGEDTIASYNAAGNGSLNELWTDEMGFSGRFWGITVNNANAKTLRMRVIEGANNTVISTFALTINEDGRWDLTFELVRQSATAFSSVATTMVGPAAGPSRIGTSVANGATAVWANNVEIRLTAEATTTSDIVVQGGTVKLLNLNA